jgi:aspartyl-tRNA(Asn)/glutamyl-tRNA(Gln) amidotransferase subunit C
MSITKQTVKKISKLARIASNEKFEESMIKDLNSILKFMDQLNELKIDNVEPLASVVNQELIQREDKIEMKNTKVDILSNSPEKNTDFYVVPKVIE